MLVEINLLPKKENKNYMLITILLGTVFLILVAGIFLFWHGKNLDNQITTLDNQIATTQKLIQIEQEKAEGGNGENSVAVLKSAVQWASDEPLKTVPIIQQVVKLLPNRGFIQSISYDETGTVNLTVQFDTSRESAYYLKTLLDSDWFSEVNLSSIQTSAVSETAEEEEIVPRYIGQYQLKLNKSFIQNQEQIQQSLDNNEGSVGS